MEEDAGVLEAGAEVADGDGGLLLVLLLLLEAAMPAERDTSACVARPAQDRALLVGEIQSKAGDGEIFEALGKGLGLL